MKDFIKSVFGVIELIFMILIVSLIFFNYYFNDNKKDEKQDVKISYLEEDGTKCKNKNKDSFDSILAKGKCVGIFYDGTKYDENESVNLAYSKGMNMNNYGYAIYNLNTPGFNYNDLYDGNDTTFLHSKDQNTELGYIFKNKKIINKIVIVVPQEALNSTPKSFVVKARESTTSDWITIYEVKNTIKNGKILGDKENKSMTFNFLNNKPYKEYKISEIKSYKDPFELKISELKFYNADLANRNEK